MGENLTESDPSLGMLSSRMRGSIAQRRAAKFGFNALGISSTAIFRADTLLASPTARSPRLTIPPGISPTALLDSPVMLHNSQAQPSPTTGTLPLSPLNREGLFMHPVDSIGERNTCSDVSSSFMFRPHCVQASTNRESISTSHQAVTDFKFLPDAHEESVKTSPQTTTDFTFVPDIHKESYTGSNINDTHYSVKDHAHIRNGDFTTPEVFCSDQRNDASGEDLTPDRTEVYQRDASLSMDHDGALDDGFNWRKYGQKHVKGSEFPRSYYKCTHPNCQVKKKVERSLSGEITEITYKGSHGHPKPRLGCHRDGPILSLNGMMDVGESSRCGAKEEGRPFFERVQLGCKEVLCGPDCKVEGMELTSSTSVLTDLSDLATQAKAVGGFESVETPEFSSTLATGHDYDGGRGDDEGVFAQASVSLADEADEGESESKRRRMESSLMETSLATRAIREPRVVVQIESDIDILDDGYRWRKYGQKVVKGNPNPRSYYKCTSAGCSVRKHVERAPHDLKCVITTYEGKHNHEVPVARSGGGGGTHVGPPGGGNGPAPAGSRLRKTPEFGEFMRLRAPPTYQEVMQNHMRYGMDPGCGIFPIPLPSGLFNVDPNHVPPLRPPPPLYTPSFEHDMGGSVLDVLEPVTFMRRLT